MIQDRKGQAAAWGFLAMLVFIAISAGLVDLYRLYEARNWGYRMAQEAALTGASKGRDWAAILSTGQIRLQENAARDEAVRLAQAELAARGISTFLLDVRVLPEMTGGTISAYPPRPVRLGHGLGNWTSNEPAVGVYLSFPVDWLLLDRIGVVNKNVSVFAAAGVAH